MKKTEKIINYLNADFWIFVDFLTKINTNSAKSCLLFRRKAIPATASATASQSYDGRAAGGTSGRRYLYDEIASNFWAEISILVFIFGIKNIFFFEVKKIPKVCKSHLV